MGVVDLEAEARVESLLLCVLEGALAWGSSSFRIREWCCYFLVACVLLSFSFCICTMRIFTYL